MAKLYYYSDGSKILVQSCGDEFLATPVEALALEADLCFAWHRDGAACLWNVWERLGAKLIEGTVAEFKAKGGVFAQAAEFFENQQKLEVAKN